MAYSRSRPSAGGSSVISMLSQRYKEPDSAQTNPAGAGRPRILYGQTAGDGAGKGSGSLQRSEETTYSFSQEEETRVDGRTVYKTKEEKSFSEKPQHWPGDSAAPAPKVSTKVITLSTKAPGAGQPTQLTNSFGGPQKQSITIASGQPQRQQDYQYQQTITTKTQYGVTPQQQQQQQSVYQQQQRTYGQQQPTYGQQQPTYGQQQTTYSQQQTTYGQQQPTHGQQQTTYGQQQQASYGQQKQQPTHGQQQQPSYSQQKPQPIYGQQQQPVYGQQKQQPIYGQQQQPVYGQQKPEPIYGQQQQPVYGQQKQQPVYGQQQQQQQQQQPRYGQQQQQTTYSQTQKTTTTYQQEQPQQQQGYAAQQPSYQQQKQQQQQQQQQVSYHHQQQQQPQQQQRPGYPQQQAQQQPQQRQQYQQSVSTVRTSSGGQAPGQQSSTVTTTTTKSSTSAAGQPFPWEEEPEEGVHENVPEQRADLVRESDRKNWGAELPSAGLARNIKEKFITGNLENRPASFRREMTPPGMARGGGGVFENQPAYNPDVVHHGEEVQREALPERGTARNMAQRFKQIGTEGPRPGSVPDKRDITPDRTTRVEYVSEPRGYVEKYEGRPESGVFESQPVYLPDVIKADEYEDDRMQECGLARNMAAHFRQVGNLRPPPSPSRLKEFTPPREGGSALQGYGVYESSPQYDPSVVHHEDLQHDILPQRGMARTIVTRFRKMSAGDASAKASRGKKEFTPPRDGGGVYENEPLQFIPDYNRQPESGILENQPEVRYDVVRADAPPAYELELPDRGTARNLVHSWRQKESGSSQLTPTGSGKPKEFTPPREEPRVLVYRAAAPRTPRSAGDYDQFSYGPGDGSVHPYDLPGQYQPMAEASVFESDPVLLEDVYREADTDWMEGMPRSDSTRKMVAKFRHIQQQAATTDFTPPAGSRPPLSAQDGEDRNSRETTPDKVGRSKSMRVAVQLEKCGACQKTVYAMEKIEIEKNAYHKSCFRCSHCHCVLTPKTFAINKNVMFCTNHYKQLFATKGNYDEGFGHDQHKNRWKHGDQSRDSSPLQCTDTTTAAATSTQQ